MTGKSAEILNENSRIAPCRENRHRFPTLRESYKGIFCITVIKTLAVFVVNTVYPATGIV